MMYDLALAWLNYCAQVPPALYLWAVLSPVWVPLVTAVGITVWWEGRQ
jgi:hypothetical protein